MIKWTPALVDRLVELRDKGLSCADSAREMGLSYETISSKAHKLGLKFSTRAKPPPPMRWDAELERRLDEMKDAGLCYSEIAAGLGVTKNAVIGKLSRIGSISGDARFERMVDAMAAAHADRCVVVFPPSGRCQWPSGEPGRPDFSFCAAPVKRHSPPYCERHLRMGGHHA